MNLFSTKSTSSLDLLISEGFDCHDAFGHGLFQRRLLLLTIIAIFVANSEGALLAVIASDVDHWCRQPPNLNVSVTFWKNSAIPVEANGRLSRCHIYKHPEDPNDTQVVTCDEWNYDDQRAMQTVVSVWNLVCHRRGRLALVLVTQFLGSIVFLVATGPASDWIGRVKVIRLIIPILLVATIILCVATTYAFFTITRFFVSGLAICSMALCSIVNFEVMAHQNRPLHVIFCSAMGFLVADLWRGIMGYFEIHWKLKQVIFLTPVILSLPAVFVMPESPRWLIASGQLKEAECAMLAAAEQNNFPLPSTAAFLGRLSAQVDKNRKPTGQAKEDVLEGCSFRLRALIMFGCYFSVCFSLYITIFSSVSRREGFLQIISSIMVFLAFTGMIVVVTKFPLLKVLTACFAALGAVQCALSMATTLNTPVISRVLIVVMRPLALVGMVVSIAYTLELFPTALRGTALCWTLGSGRFGAVVACATFGLQQVGREDVAFASAGSILWLSLLAFRRLPPATTVECSKMEASRRVTLREEAVDHMKSTLKHLLPGRPRRSMPSSPSSPASPKAESSRPKSPKLHKQRNK